MDLLSKAYAEGSGEDGELAAPTTSKRRRPETHASQQNRQPPPRIYQHRGSPIESPAIVASRYISKRERAILAASSTVSDPCCPLPLPTAAASRVVGTVLDLDIPRDIAALLRHQPKVHAKSNKVPGELSVSLNGHQRPVNSLQWSPSHGHLLASAGMDETVYVWNVWSQHHQKARVFKYHNAAVKDVRWSIQGLSLLSCGYDCSSRLVDVEKGKEIDWFREDQVVKVVKFHPYDPNLFLSGGDKGFLRLWDVRISKVVHEYHKGLGPILDIEFRPDGKQFISSSDTSQSRISENSIVVWDFSRQIPLSNQVYVEAYTCPCIRFHPTDACFVAQSNGNYIACFSSRPPFKLDRCKRYENHGVWGFPIKCNFSMDGKKLASGSSDGSIYFYSYHSSDLLRKVKAFAEACIDVAFHPIMPNVIASCSWTGEISVFEFE